MDIVLVSSFLTWTEVFLWVDKGMLKTNSVDSKEMDKINFEFQKRASEFISDLFYIYLANFEQNFHYSLYRSFWKGFGPQGMSCREGNDSQLVSD